MGIETVLKVGGSLARREGLEALGQEIGRLGARHPILVIPGGGAFADAVRAQYRRYRLGETAAHRMALLAMDQYGILLGELVPDSVLATDLALAQRVAGSGRVPILLAASLLVDADPLPHSWQVTSDSIAAWVAGQIRAQRLVLLKDVDGLFDRAPGEEAKLLQQVAVRDLTLRQGGVDEHLRHVLGGLDLGTWVVNGRHPERLAELLQAGGTIGTRISRCR